MAKTKSFQELDVWKSAHSFVLEVYQFTENFPKSELYGLVSQFRRAAPVRSLIRSFLSTGQAFLSTGQAVSIPANIAEGYAKYGLKDKVRFYNIAQGSAEECRYYLILSSDLGYGAIHELKEKLEIVYRMLQSYINGVRKNYCLLPTVY